jgi:serine/threonine protein kinase
MTEPVESRYEVLGQLGAGGQATVFKAMDARHQRIVALKQYEISEGTKREEFLAEAGMLLELQHPGLPLVRDDILLDDQGVIVMDWVDGIDGDTLLETRGDPGLPLKEVIDYVQQVADALDYLHGHDPPIVHGDVKPQNLIITKAGQVVLVDFGVAAIEHADGPMGTVGYMAPETAAGERPTPAADIFGLAATAVALLTGEAPDGRGPAWAGLDLDEVSAVARTLRRALAIDPAARQATAGEFAERLRAARHPSPPSGTPAFLFTDMRKASELWDTNPEVMPAINQRLVDLVTGVVEKHGGRLFRTDDDEVTTLTVFGQASQAVRAATGIVARMPEESWPGGHCVDLRLAIHSGEAELVDGDYHGVNVRRARQLRTFAPLEDILVSPTAAALLETAMPERYSLVQLPLRSDGWPERLFKVEVDETLRTPPPTEPTTADPSAPVTRGASLRDRLLSPPVLEAMWSPSAILAAGSGAAVGVVVSGPALGVATGVAAWLVRLAVAVPGRPRADRVEPYMLDEPWRRLVVDAQQARDQFRAAIAAARPGPLRDHLTEIDLRLDDAVRDSWQVALRGQTLSRARSTHDAAGLRVELQALTDDPASSASSLEAAQRQLDAVERMDRVISDARDRLRLTVARLREAVATVVELSVHAVSDASAVGLGADVERAVDDLETLAADVTSA